jgi:flagellin
MNSLLTNTASMTALRVLASTESTLTKTSNSVSTGLRIADATDGASYWSIAEKLKSDNTALDAVKTALGESSAMIDNMNSAMVGTLSVMNTIKTALITAMQPGADRDQIDTDIQLQKKAIYKLANSAIFNKQNWLVDNATTGTQADTSLVASYDGIKVSYITVDLASMKLFDATSAPDGENPTSGGIFGNTTFDVYDSNNNPTGTTASIFDITTGNASYAQLTGQSGYQITNDDLNRMIQALDSAVDQITASSATLGALQNQVGDQQYFVQTRLDNLTAGTSALVDTNMDEYSARLQALQAKQLLGVQALQIANQDPSLILKLLQ